MAESSHTPEQMIAAAWDHLRAGRLKEAEGLCRRVLGQDPGRPEALHVLGIIANQVGRSDAAVELFNRALALRPQAGEVVASLGLAQQNLGRFADAEATYRRATGLLRDHWGVRHNLGVVLERQGRLMEAEHWFAEAVRLAPNDALAHLNYGITLRQLGRIEDALPHLRRAVKLDPDNPDSHMMLAWALLLDGQFEEGWAQYEWRLRRAGFRRPAFSQPIWDGSSPHGGTILLHHEQGLGDTIQFVRYASLLSGAGARVIVLCPGSLRQLISTERGVALAVDRLSELPAFDAWVPILSLPGRFRTRLQTIPAHVPYLSADDKKLAEWSQRLGGDRAGLKVGLCWAGSRGHINDLNRSIPLATFAPLAQVPRVTLYSLQVGDAAREASASALPLVDHTNHLRDFADTAALLCQLDLVISVDTAIVHLAGALARPVWLLVPVGPDWRWLLQRDDSPWYPTMRLFRRSPDQPWDQVIARVAVELTRLAR